VEQDYRITHSERRERQAITISCRLISYLAFLGAVGVLQRQPTEFAAPRQPRHGTTVLLRIGNANPVFPATFNL